MTYLYVTETKEELQVELHKLETELANVRFLFDSAAVLSQKFLKKPEKLEKYSKAMVDYSSIMAVLAIKIQGAKDRIYVLDNTPKVTDVSSQVMQQFGEIKQGSN